jgi:hypothetical protein
MDITACCPNRPGPASRGHDQREAIETGHFTRLGQVLCPACRTCRDNRCANSVINPFIGKHGFKIGHVPIKAPADHSAIVDPGHIFSTTSKAACSAFLGWKIGPVLVIQILVPYTAAPVHVAQTVCLVIGAPFEHGNCKQRSKSQ